ncbi:MAG: DUF4115 domain-containing protein [Candidatus Moranbacteria bacterium]|nr:DUF4115 domain-containing protein [Candidatus Moranbacteria bacterium]
MLGNGFTKKSVGTLTLGEKLKKIRGERRISLMEVSRHTRIPVKYLELLDEGAYDRLPADVYVKGFLRSYADFMGMNEKVLIKLYEKERGIQTNLDKDKVNKNEIWEKIKPIKISSFVITPRFLAIGTAILILAGGIFYLYREVGSFSTAPRLVIISPENEMEASGNSAVVEGVTDADAQVFINGQPILVNDEGNFRENVTLQAGENVIAIEAKNRFGKETKNTLTVKSKAVSETAAAENNPNPEIKSGNETSSDKVNVEIRVDPGPVWLSVESDGNLVFSGTMLSGAVQTFQAAEKITIDSGKGNATFVKLNGRDLGPLSQNPEAVRGAVFTPDTKK